jgi:hypothetical protein
MNFDNLKLEKLHYTFPKLTEANQLFVLGFAEGLKQAQNCKVDDQSEEVKASFVKKEITKK